MRKTPISFTSLTDHVERCISRLSFEYHLAPASILTEYDLKSRLHHLLNSLHVPPRRGVTFQQRLQGWRAHSDLSWFDETDRLRIRPDITILEPEHLRLPAHQLLDPFSGGGYPYRRGPRLPSKQFEFTGNTITLELKFARNGIDNAIAKLIRKDFQKMKRLFRILDNRAEGDSIFSYLVIFNRLDQPPWETPLAEFFRDHRESVRHRIVYQTSRSASKQCFRPVCTNWWPVRKYVTKNQL